jgi:hypothetical protein
MNYTLSIVCFLKVTQNKSITKAAVELHATSSFYTVKEFSGSI